MKLLFIQGGSRWKFDTENNIYTDANFNDLIWNRYGSYSDELKVVLRQENKIYGKGEAVSKFNRFNTSKFEYVALPDLYQPVKNIFSIEKRKKVLSAIENEVKECDKLIIRSLGNIYTNSALKFARKYDKPYLVEVTGFVFESFWYHSLRGKIMASFQDMRYRKLMKDVPYAVYVTESALQKRYFCKGRTLGCSDVELPVQNIELIREQRKQSFEKKRKIVIGTAAFLDVSWKGQKYVIEAIAQLVKQGMTCFKYELVGAGTGEKLKKLSEKLGVSEYISIIGVLPHEKIFEWLDGVDIYIQPSFQEGLCRALVEAMSRGCPVMGSDVGGNYELVSERYLFRKGNSKEIADKLLRILENDERYKESERSFMLAEKYEKKYLDSKRDAFYHMFMGE